MRVTDDWILDKVEVEIIIELMSNKILIVGLVVLVGVIGLATIYGWMKRVDALYTVPRPDGHLAVVVSPTPESSPVAKVPVALTVSSPTNGQTVNTPSVQVRGKTVAGAIVYVNDVETKADSQGNFAMVVKLDEGENVIVVTAVDEGGNSTEREVVVNFGVVE